MMQAKREDARSEVQLAGIVCPAIPAEKASRGQLDDAALVARAAERDHGGALSLFGFRGH